MPRLTDMQGYRFAVRDTTIPVVDPKDGQPIYGMDGQPKTQPAKERVAFDQLGDAVKFVLTDDIRHELVKLLTGGVIVPEIEIVKH